MTFGERVANMLELRGWSQSQLAERSRQAQKKMGQAGTIQQSTISRIVGQNRAPGLDVAAAIALALDTSLDWLVGIRGYTEDSVAKTPDERATRRRRRR